MAFDDIYDCIKPFFVFLSFFGLAPYAFRVSATNTKYIKLDYITYFWALAVICVGITFQVIYLQQDINNFKEVKDLVDRLSVLTYCASTNLARIILIIYFVTPLLYYKKLANVIKTLHEIDQVLGTKGIVVNHKNVVYGIFGLIIVSFVHFLMRTISEATVKGQLNFFYNLFLQAIHTYYALFFSVLAYLTMQRFQKLTEYLSLYKEKDTTIFHEKKLYPKRAWISVGFDYHESMPNTPSNFSQENLLRKTMDLHAKLHDCMKEVGECFQIPLMFVFIQEFLNIVYSFYIFYGVISYGVAHHGTQEDLNFEIYSFTQSYAKVAVMTWCGDALACESKGILRVVSKLSRRPDNTLDDKRKIRQFFLQLMHNDLGISVIGFYNIDWLAHFSMLTTMFNYLMVTISLTYY